MVLDWSTEPLSGTELQSLLDVNKDFLVPTLSASMTVLIPKKKNSVL